MINYYNLKETLHFNVGDTRSFHYSLDFKKNVLKVIPGTYRITCIGHHNDQYFTNDLSFNKPLNLFFYVGSNTFNNRQSDVRLKDLPSSDKSETIISSSYGKSPIKRDGCIIITCLSLVKHPLPPLLNWNQEKGEEIIHGEDDQYWEFRYTGYPQSFEFTEGKYKIEIAGANGRGENLSEGICLTGRGEIITAFLNVTSPFIGYIYIGEVGRVSINEPSWNGGGSGGMRHENEFSGGRFDIHGGGGGGASDIRLVNGDWKDKNSLVSRIIVAGGGGGSSAFYDLLGIDIPNEDGSGGDAFLFATAGKCKGVSSPIRGADVHGGYAFGYGKDADIDHSGGGGGGGYFGGFAPGFSTCPEPDYTGGGGGSSFISGYEYCRSVDETGKLTNSPIHYSGIVFTDVSVGDHQEYGRNYSGYCKITKTGNKWVEVNYPPPEPGAPPFTSVPLSYSNYIVPFKNIYFQQHSIEQNIKKSGRFKRT